MSHNSSQTIEISICLPCLNEAGTIGDCLQQAFGFLQAQGITGEVIVGDNGSTDGSARIAEERGARLVRIRARGYGAALAGAISAAHGRFVIMADADGTYDLENLMPFVEKLRAGYDLVVGNRFQGGIETGAMSWKNRCIGNPVLSGIGRLLYPTAVRDFHCGLRGFSRGAFARMDLRSTGMEFASEMIASAVLRGMRITEVPTILRAASPSRRSHLRPWRDGWRHLRFMLMYSSLPANGNGHRRAEPVVTVSSNDPRRSRAIQADPLRLPGGDLSAAGPE